MPLLGAIARAPLLGASYQLWRSSRWVPLLGARQGCHCWVLATNFGGVHVGCHCWVPLLGRHCWVLATNFGGVHVGCHCWVPGRGAIAGC